MALSSDSYSSYVRLDRLLTAQQPKTSRDQETLWISERFFIICHQTSELWLSQVLLDLSAAVSLARQSDWAAADAGVARAASIMQLLIQHVDQLRHLPQEHFLQFRIALDGMSAMESEQFGQILKGTRNPLIQDISMILSKAFSEIEGSPHPDGKCTHDQCATTRSLKAFLKAVTAWRRLHLEMVTGFIGSRQGTGGTAGSAFLRNRLLGDSDDTPGEPWPWLHSGSAEYPGTA
jgi:tryptophan 2,3-dioxygenase